MNRYSQHAVIVLCIFYLLTACPSNADNGMYPNIGADITATLQLDAVHLTNQKSAATSTNTYGEFNPVTHFRFSPDDEIWLDATIGSIAAPTPGNNLFFSDTALTINALNYYRYADNYLFRLGKFNVDFGRASDFAPGLYTANLTDDYRSDGVLGASYAISFWSDIVGVLQPALSAYFIDTTVLSRSFFQKSQRVRRSDGGPANTNQPNSFAVTVNWLAIPAIPFLELQGGYKLNHRSQGNAEHEQLTTLSARYIWALPASTLLASQLGGGYLDVVPFIEWVNIENRDGIKGRNAQYLTTALTVDYGYWSLGVSRVSAETKGLPRESINEMSFQYLFRNLMSIEVGAGYQSTGNEESLLFGISWVYASKL